MTRNEKLDKILFMLIAVDVKELKNESINMPITMEFINEAFFELELIEWEMKSLKDELINEELVIEKNEELRITQKGKKFITRGKGFRNLEKISEQKETIREKTIEKFRYDKIAFWFALIVIGISLAGLFFG